LCETNIPFEGFFQEPCDLIWNEILWILSDEHDNTFLGQALNKLSKHNKIGVTCLIASNHSQLVPASGRIDASHSLLVLIVHFQQYSS
jgi:hypothetical protein